MNSSSVYEDERGSQGVRQMIAMVTKPSRSWIVQKCRNLWYKTGRNWKRKIAVHGALRLQVSSNAKKVYHGLHCVVSAPKSRTWCLRLWRLIAGVNTGPYLGWRFCHVAFQPDQFVDILCSKTHMPCNADAEILVTISTIWPMYSFLSTG
jgi:hypothetical protein